MNLELHRCVFNDLYLEKGQHREVRQVAMTRILTDQVLFDKFACETKEMQGYSGTKLLQVKEVFHLMCHLKLLRKCCNAKNVY